MKTFDPDKSVHEYEEEYNKDLRFDKFNLDDEYVEHPELYMSWVKQYAGALTARKMSEDNLEKIKGSLDLKVRKNPELYDLVPDSKGKVMESAIKAVVNTHDDVETAQKHFYKMYELAKVLEFAVKAFEHRKELLKGEGELWINSYYSGIETKVKEVGDKEQNKKELRNGTRRRKLIK